VLRRIAWLRGSAVSIRLSSRTYPTMTAPLQSTALQSGSSNGTAQAQALGSTKPKLAGRAFYESIGSPKYILAPMVDQSEFVGVSSPLLSPLNKI
jgi:hypothetical protein